jgi:hypothetical protein
MERYDEEDKVGTADVDISVVPDTTDADGGAATDKKVVGGLMSRPRATPERDIEESETTAFSEAINSLYDQIGKAESTEHHLGGADYEQVGITMSYGVLPDSGLKYKHEGKIIELADNDYDGATWESLKKAGVTTENFKPENVITDDVVKDGVKRSDYSSDEEFTKALLVKFENALQEEVEAEGLNYDKIPKQAKKGLVSFAWNARGHKYKQMEPAFKEIVKDSPDMKIIQTGMLQTYTSKGIVKRGLAYRRATDYNDVAAALNKPTIKSYIPVKLDNGNAGIKFKFSDDTTLTDDTNKDYETKASQADFKKHINKEFNI